MVAIADIRRWDAGVLDEIFTALGRHRDSLVELQDELDRSRAPEGWSGDAAPAARANHDRLSEQTRRLVAGVSGVRRSAGEAADAVPAIQRALGEAEDKALFHGFRVGENGGVEDVHPPRVLRHEVEAVQAERAAVRDDVLAQLEQIERRADDVAADVAAVLGRAARGELDDGSATTQLGAAALGGHLAGGLSLTPPPEDGSPAENAAYWESLSGVERTELITTSPQLVGNMDGVPGEVRHQVNEFRLAGEQRQAHAEIARLQAVVDSNAGAPGSAITTREDRARIAQLTERLVELDAIETTMNLPGERQLLLLDTSGERVRTAIAHGNVDTADHVAVMTPGFTSNAAGIEGYDREMRDLRFLATREGTGSVATVTYLGYDAPQWSGVLSLSDSVLSQGAAERGAKDLTEFYQGINASRVEEPHLTALGHSYGSTTTGLALQHDTTGVDDVVFYGSPGIGTDDVTELGVPPGNVYSVEAPWDPIADIPAFGSPNPEETDGVTSLSAREEILPGGREFEGSAGHSSYLDDGTTAQYNMALVVAGAGDEAVRDDGSDWGDILW